MRCPATVLGLVCELEEHGPEREHHFVAGHCPTHGRPLTRRRQADGAPRCGECGLLLVPMSSLPADRVRRS